MNNQRCAVIYIFFLLLFGCLFSAHANLDTDTGVRADTKQNKRIDHSYPVFVHTISESGKLEPYVDSESFLKTLNEETLNSIRSPEEMFIHVKKTKELNKESKLYEVFRLFYLGYLPVLILADKIEQIRGVESEVESSIKATEVLNFVFRNDTLESPAEKAVKLANKYKYNSHERLNLFVRALYQNTVSEQDLMEMMSAWKIQEQRGIYMRPYQKYANIYQGMVSVELQEQNKEASRQKSSAVFSLTSPFMSSLLHEVFFAQRLSVFNALLKSESISVFQLNTPDYLHRSVLHLMSGVEWEKTEPYFKSFMRHHQLVDFNMQEYKGWTPLAYAVANEGVLALDFIQQLFAFKDRLQLDLLDSHQRTAVNLAAELAMPDLARFLYEKGVPRQEIVSDNNIFIDKSFRVFKFISPLGVLFDKFSAVFDIGVLVKNNMRASYKTFTTAVSDGTLSKDKDVLEAYRYYFLFDFFQQLFQFEEQKRGELILASVTGQHLSSESDRGLARLLKAIRSGDVSFLQDFFSLPGNRKRYINQSFFYKTYKIYTPRVLRLFSVFELKRYFPVNVTQTSAVSIEIPLQSVNLLVEAVRFNQPEIVSILLEAGANPIHPTGFFGIRDALAAGILVGALFLNRPELYQKHIKIMNALINHPDVTKEFLNRASFFGMNYADLATVRGDLSTLKLLYAKGVEVSPTLSFWKTGVSAVDVAMDKKFIGTGLFVLEQELKKAPNNKGVARQLNQCRRAFN